VLAVRFFLILAVTWTLTGLSAKPQLAATFLPALFIAVIGAAIPLYLLQVGIKRMHNRLIGNHPRAEKRNGQREIISDQAAHTRTRP
jgi:hypothetical protein